MKKYQSGFTLIEIAIVLLIIGLLLGGVVKGQSMINSARVRSIANDLTGIEAGWISFQDRYRSLPGDFPRASTHIATGTTNGNANAIVDATESGLVWQHLASAGFISGGFDGAAVSVTDTACQESTCPGNPFNGFYKISNSTNALGAVNSGHELTTGGNIPVEVMYELDLKIDDGKPDTGRLRSFVGGAHDVCVADGEWDVVNKQADCAGVIVLPL